MKTIKNIIDFFRPKINIFYQKKDGSIDRYKVSKLSYLHHFGNKKQYQDNVGIRAYCYKRKGIRSFRYDGILAVYK